MKFILYHDCNDCKHNKKCTKEKSTSTDCKGFEWNLNWVGVK